MLVSQLVEREIGSGKGGRPEEVRRIYRRAETGKRNSRKRTEGGVLDRDRPLLCKLAPRPDRCPTGDRPVLLSDSGSAQQTPEGDLSSHAEPQGSVNTAQPPARGNTGQENSNHSPTLPLPWPARGTHEGDAGRPVATTTDRR